MKEYTLGIDLHKRTSAWVVIDRERNVVWEDSVAVHPSHISTAVQSLPIAPSAVQVAIEPVLGWRWVSTQLEESGMEIHPAHPEQIRLIAESMQKTDREDARTLAELLHTGYFPEAYRVSDEIHNLRTLVRSRAHVVNLRTSVKNRLHGMATTHGLHTVSGGNPLTKHGRTSLEETGNPAFQEMFGVGDDLAERISMLERAITRSVTNDSVVRCLRTIPGVGVITAATIRAEMGEVSRFPAPEKFANFAGLVPRQRSSGERVRYGSITNAGSRHLRTALVEAAMRISQRNAPELHAFYSKKKPEIGAKRARIALARKLCVIAWAVATQETTYHPSSVSSPHHAPEQS